MATPERTVREKAAILAAMRVPPKVVGVTDVTRSLYWRARLRLLALRTRNRWRRWRQ